MLYDLLIVTRLPGLQFGRKIVLVATLVVMGLSTFALGCIPEYSKIGDWSYGEPYLLLHDISLNTADIFKCKSAIIMFLFSSSLT